MKSDTEYSDGEYSTAEDLKDIEYFSHRYKLTRSAKRVPKPAHPRPQPSEETQPKEVVEVTPVQPPPVVNPKADTKPQPAYQVPDFRAVDMNQQIEEVARDMIRRGEFDHLFHGGGNQGDDVEDLRRGQGHGYGGRGKGRHGQPRQDDRDRSRNRDRSLRYSIRDIPTFDGKGDSMPHTHLIEFEDFFMNT